MVGTHFPELHSTNNSVIQYLVTPLMNNIQCAYDTQQQLGFTNIIHTNTRLAFIFQQHISQPTTLATRIYH